MPKKLTKEEFIQKARIVHKDKYNYSLVDYVNNNTKVKIICPEHGEFEQTPKNHMKGRGCLVCGAYASAAHKKDDKESFVNKAKEVHGNKYNYNFVEYVNSRQHVFILCNTCDFMFSQHPKGHLRGRGCPRCGRVISKNEKIIYDFFKKKGFTVHMNYKPIWLDKKHLDLYIPDLNLAVEYNGTKFHHSSLGISGFTDKTYKDPEYHKWKYKTSLDNGVNLVHIFEFEDLDKWLKLINSYVEAPSNYTISFNNIKRVVDKFTLYGQSFIKEKE